MAASDITEMEKMTFGSVQIAIGEIDIVEWWRKLLYITKWDLLLHLYRNYDACHIMMTALKLVSFVYSKKRIIVDLRCLHVCVEQ